MVSVYTQKTEHNIQNTADVWNQEWSKFLRRFLHFIFCLQISIYVQNAGCIVTWPYRLHRHMTISLYRHVAIQTVTSRDLKSVSTCDHKSASSRYHTDGLVTWPYNLYRHVTIQSVSLRDHTDCIVTWPRSLFICWVVLLPQHKLNIVQTTQTWNLHRLWLYDSRLYICETPWKKYFAQKFFFPEPLEGICWIVGTSIETATNFPTTFITYTQLR
jgi:hypothetical protein